MDGQAAAVRKGISIRTEKRAELSGNRTTALRLAAFVFALAAGGVFMAAIGYNPLAVYGTMVYGSFRSRMAIQAMVKLIIPLLISSLGVTLAFKMKFWNIGAEGQIIMGAIFASGFALYMDSLPHGLLMAVMLAAGMLGGGLWGLLPAFCKARFGTNETLLTLMLNYIALYTIKFLQNGPWADPSSPGYSKIARFADNAQLDKVLGVQAGWIIALVFVVLVYIYLKYTKSGYEIGVVGDSKATAEYAGMNVRRIILKTMFLSGGICGVCGMVQAAGSDMTLAAGVAGGVGFTAIIVAWLARLNPVNILVVSFLFGILQKGSTVVQSTYGLSANSAEVLEGIILFFVLGCEFFIRYRFAVERRGGESGC